MTYNKLSGYKTNVVESNGKGMVQYHSTVIVEWVRDKITLRSGGWETVTTKRKMNQAAIQFDLDYGVFQKNYEWFVDLPNGNTVPFVDGMSFKTA